MHTLAWLVAITLGWFWTGISPGPSSVEFSSRPALVGWPAGLDAGAPHSGAARVGWPRGPGAVGVAPRSPAGDLPLAPVRAGSFRWPLDGAPRVVRRFDPPPSPWLPGHRGVDLAAEAGDPVRASGPGTVHFAGWVGGRRVVSVTHADGLRITYEPVEPTVRTGQAVAAGAQLGTLAAGHPGCRAPACLHWGLRRGEEYLDPLALLGLGRVRLLPLDDPSPHRAATPADPSHASHARPTGLTTASRPTPGECGPGEPIGGDR